MREINSIDISNTTLVNAGGTYDNSIITYGDFTHIKFSSANAFNNTIFKHCDFTNCTIDADLNNVKFSYCNFSNCKFNGKLNDVQFTDCELINCNFYNNMTTITFDASVLSNCHFYDDMTSANFSDCEFCNCSFKSKFDNVKFDKVELEVVTIECKNTINSIISDSELTNCTITGGIVIDISCEQENVRYNYIECDSNIKSKAAVVESKETVKENIKDNVKEKTEEVKENKPKYTTPKFAKKITTNSKVIKKGNKILISYLVGLAALMTLYGIFR